MFDCHDDIAFSVYVEGDDENEEELSCCNDVITDDGFCPTCWEHCK